MLDYSFSHCNRSFYPGDSENVVENGANESTEAGILINTNKLFNCLRMDRISLQKQVYIIILPLVLQSVVFIQRIQNYG